MNPRALRDEIADFVESAGRPDYAAFLRAQKIGGRPQAKRVDGFTERDWLLAELHCRLKDQIEGGKRAWDVINEASEDATITDKLSKDIEDVPNYLGRLVDLGGSFHRLRPLVKILRTQNVSCTSSPRRTR